MTYQVLEGDCVELMAAMPAGSVDSVVCDPPYGLEFMGKEWDRLSKGYEQIGDINWPPESTDEQTDDQPTWTCPNCQAVVLCAWEQCQICGAENPSKGGRGWRNRSDADRAWQERQPKVPDGLPPTSRESINARRRNAPDYGKPNPAAMQEWHQAWATEALRVLKPGGHLLAFGGTRTYHRLVCAVEDAGFEIRDTISWLYGSGFPKSLDVSKAIDRRRDDRADTLVVTRQIEAARLRAGLSREDLNEALCGSRHRGRPAQLYLVTMEDSAVPPVVPHAKHWEVLRSVLDVNGMADEVERLNARKGQMGEAWYEREVVGERTDGAANGSMVGLGSPSVMAREYDETAPATPEAERWEGWGTALKPAHEPVVVARKPLSGTVAACVLEHGTGALNVDGCRVEHDGSGVWGDSQHSERHEAVPGGGGHTFDGGPTVSGVSRRNDAGRWPANVVLDGEAARLLDEQTGEQRARGNVGPTGRGRGEANGWGMADAPGPIDSGDTGGASRFFYVAKASRGERNAGLEGFEEKDMGEVFNGGIEGASIPLKGSPAPKYRNVHPTVKPIGLMRWLVRLVTPPGGTVLDPFAGSGTTGCAAVLEGFDFIGLEREPEYVAIAEARIRWWHKHRGDGEATEILAAGEFRDSVEATGQLGMFDQPEEET